MSSVLPFPDAKYRCILADPPWHYQTWGKHSGGKHASVHYPTMRIDEIMALPVNQLADDDCVLFLWTVQWLPPRAVADLLDAWGFTYKTVAFTWVKLSPNGLLHWGMGQWSRQGSEQCILATVGSPKRADRGVHQDIIAPVREHSRKPDEQYDRIERLLGLTEPGDKIELFARQSWPGWDSWGLETGRFDADVTESDLQVAMEL